MPTEDDVEQKQVRDHERHRKVQQTPREALLLGRCERDNESLHDRVQQRKGAEEGDGLLEHIQRPNAIRSRIFQLVHKRRRQLVPREVAERDVRRPPHATFDRAVQLALKLDMVLGEGRDGFVWMIGENLRGRGGLCWDGRGVDRHDAGSGRLDA